MLNEKGIFFHIQDSDAFIQYKALAEHRHFLNKAGLFFTLFIVIITNTGLSFLINALAHKDQPKILFTIMTALAIACLVIYWKMKRKYTFKHFYDIEKKHIEDMVFTAKVKSEVDDLTQS